jgi:hypothetical protein
MTAPLVKYCLAVLLFSTACNTTPAPNGSAASATSLAANSPAQIDYLQPQELASALHALLDPLSPPIRLLSVVALPSQVIIQVQNPADHSQVNELRYKGGQLSGPTPVKLLGKGNLKDNLFNLEAADPQVATQVLSSVRAEYKEPIRKLVMIRNLPNSLDIQFRAYLRGNEAETVIAADKLGKLLGPITVYVPSPN